MIDNKQENNYEWRKLWFVQNVLVEIPIAGSFFKERTFGSGLRDALKCGTKVAGSLIGGMALSSEAGYMHSASWQSAGGMVAGMMFGGITFNVAYTAAVKTSEAGKAMLLQFDCMKSATISVTTSVEDDLEMQTLKGEEKQEPQSTDAQRVSLH